MRHDKRLNLLGLFSSMRRRLRELPTTTSWESTKTVKPDLLASVQWYGKSQGTQIGMWEIPVKYKVFFRMKAVKTIQNVWNPHYWRWPDLVWTRPGVSRSNFEQEVRPRWSPDIPSKIILWFSYSYSFILRRISQEPKEQEKVVRASIVPLSCLRAFFLVFLSNAKLNLLQ